MMIFDIDSSLKPIDTRLWVNEGGVYKNETYPHGEARKATIENVSSIFLKREDGGYDRDAKKFTTKTPVFRTTLPTEAVAYHQNYMDYLEFAYGNHYSIVLNPENVWYTLVAEVARAVNANPEEYASIFTDTPDVKKNIIICTSDFTEPLPMDEVYDQLKSLTPVDASLFVPHFSTMTENARMAILASLLETCSNYYNYMMLSCGFPKIKIGGTKEDWTLLADHYVDLSKVFRGTVLGKWMDMEVAHLIPTLKEFAAGERVVGPYDVANIFSSEICGSGSDKLPYGWFTKLFMGLAGEMSDRYPSHVSYVPYTNMGSEWKLAYALSHSKMDGEFLVPEFSMAQLMVLDKYSNIIYTHR